LRKIISLETPGTLTDVCWARRSLALILQSRGDFDDLCKAQELIEENLQSKAATAEDRRTKVQFLIADPRKTKINDAIAAMEDLVKRPDAALEDNFTLAQLYLKKGDKVAYEERMRSVLGASRVQTRHIVFYINTLLDRKEFEDADRWLLKLEKAAPNNFDTVRTRAEYLFRLNDYAAARDKVVTYVDNLDPKSPDRPQQLYLVAGLMEEFAGRLRGDNKQVAAADFDAKADLLFSSLRSKRVTSNGDLFYSAYLARQKRIRESLEVLKDCWESSDPNLLSLPVAAIVNSHAATAAQYEQLENIFLAAVAKFHRPTNLLLMLSVVHEEQRQYDKAKEDYREVLAKEPRNYQALNNLAVNLARNGGDLDEALSLINQALAVKGPLATVFDSRALVYIARNDPAKALEDATLAVQDSGAPEQYFHQAWAYSLLDRKSEAAAAFDAALKKGLDRKLLDPREIPMYDRLKDSL
jgi:tetratricopeptide (TPR) repeat protein